MTNKDDKGSAVMLAFNQPTDLQNAALAVGALHFTFSKGRYVWLDAKQEKSEGRPRIVCIRMAEMLEEVETNMDGPLKVEVFRNGKFVKVGGNRVGYTHKGIWKWTEYAVRRYTPDTLQSAKEYAEGD